VGLALFDLDNTLLGGDSDYLWGRFLVEHGIVDGDEYEARNQYFYDQYRAGSLDIQEFLAFSLAPLAAHPPERLHQWREAFVETFIEPIMLPAARDLLHGDGRFAGSINTNVLKKHIDFPIVSAGTFAGEALTWQHGDIWRRVYLQDGRINGYLIIGDTRSSGYIYQLYLAQKRVDKTIRTILCAPRHDGYYRFMLGLNGMPDAASV